MIFLFLSLYKDLHYYLVSPATSQIRCERTEPYYRLVR